MVICYAVFLSCSKLKYTGETQARGSDGMSEESSGPVSPATLVAKPEELHIPMAVRSGEDKDLPEVKSQVSHRRPHLSPTVHSFKSDEKGDEEDDEEDDDEDDGGDEQTRESCYVRTEERREKGKREDETDEKSEDRQQHSATFGVPLDDNGEELPFPGFAPKSLFIFSQRHWLRFACLRIITWPYPFC